MVTEETLLVMGIVRMHAIDCTAIHSVDNDEYVCYRSPKKVGDGFLISAIGLIVCYIRRAICCLLALYSARYSTSGLPSQPQPIIPTARSRLVAGLPLIHTKRAER